MSTLICGRCATVCDPVDNFCKHCGMPLTDEQLPLKSEAKLPAQWRPRVSAVVVRAAAVIAVGALSEVLARRAIGEAGRRAAGVVRLPVRQSKSVADSANTEPTLLSETVYMRRIQMRR